MLKGTYPHKRIDTVDQNANVVILRQAIFVKGQYQGRDDVYYKAATTGEPSKLKGFTHLYRHSAIVGQDYYLKNKGGCCD